MRIKLLISLCLFSALASAQETLTAKFTLTGMSEAEAVIVVSQRPDQLAASFRQDDEIGNAVIEYVVMDKKQHKMLQLGQYGEGINTYRFASEHKWETDFSPETAAGMTGLLDFVDEQQWDKEYYRLVPEKKILFGKECQKIEFLDNGQVFGTGWVMLGVQIELLANFGWERIKEGTIVEKSITYSDDEVVTTTLTKLDFSVSEQDFHFDIPENSKIILDGSGGEPGFNFEAPGSDE